MNVQSRVMDRDTGEARQRDIAMSIQRRLVAHIRDRSTDLAPTTMRVARDEYTSQAWYELEMERVFRSLPMVVGLTADLPEPGSKLTFDDVGPPIVVVRTASGAVKAFLNMCTHRGARLVDDCTTAKRMTCPFHAWTFNLDGDLIGLPGKAGFADVRREDLGLIEVPAQEWAGMIFVIARPGGADDIDVEGYLGEFAPELAQLDLGSAQRVKSTRLDVSANWKYAYNTYGEGYHFSTLHPQSIAKTAHSDMVAHDVFGRHQRLNFPYHDQDACVGQPEEEWVRRPYGGVHLLFPNAVVQVATFGPGSIFGLYRLYPDGGPDKAYSMMTTYRSGRIAPDLPMQPWEDFHDFTMNVVSNEDYSVSETGQRNLRFAPDDFQLVFGANEPALQVFHRYLAAVLGRNDGIAAGAA